MDDCDEVVDADEGDEVGMSPYSRSGRRKDPVYLASMATHILPNQAQMQQQHIDLQQQHHHLEQLHHQQMQQKQLEEQQLEYQLHLLQLQHHHQMQLNQQQVYPSPIDHQVPEMEDSSHSPSSLPLESEFHCGSGRMLKRPDLIPMGDFL